MHAKEREIDEHENKFASSFFSHGIGKRDDFFLYIWKIVDIRNNERK